MRLLVTGGAGFIGSNLVRHLVLESDATVLNVDKLTYAGHPASVRDIEDHRRYRFEQIDICDAPAIGSLFAEFQPDAVMHLAAESHVDRSIDGPAAFIQTNIVGTYTLLQAAREHWSALPEPERSRFRFLQVSTDEVYGSLGPAGLFSEETRYSPNSPYAASKAAADHLARAWHHTYGLPVLITNCSNNYGPYQFPEKLIPLLILNALAGKELPIYGRGENVRDWLYVEDHTRALCLVLEQGLPGETYNIGGQNERSNLQIAQSLCELLDELLQDSPHRPHAKLISFVQDRPGHDLRYAIDADKLMRTLGWRPQESFSSGLRKTVQWYLAHQDWCSEVTAGRYRGERLGLRA